MTLLHLHQLLRRALKQDRATANATLGTNINDVIGHLDHVEVVLNDHHGVAFVYQFVDHVKQVLDVLEVEAGGGLV